jgi:hypothetical protein
MEGANYVGYKYRADIYPTDTDLLNIKNETDRSVRRLLVSNRRRC